MHHEHSNEANRQQLRPELIKMAEEARVRPMLEYNLPCIGDHKWAAATWQMVAMDDAKQQQSNIMVVSQQNVYATGSEMDPSAHIIRKNMHFIVRRPSDGALVRCGTILENIRQYTKFEHMLATGQVPQLPPVDNGVAREYHDVVVRFVEF